MIYGVLFFVLLVGSVVVRNSPWVSNAMLHTVLETVATLLAFIIGGLALVRHYSRRQATLLLIGTGFLGAALLDLNHVLITTERFGVRPGVAADDLFAWSWIAERVFLSLFLFVALLAWRLERREGEGFREGSLYATAVTLTILILLLFEWLPVSTAHFPDFVVNRPAEFIPALFFLLAFGGFLTKASWRRDVFEHWLLISVLIAFMAHAAFMSGSTQRFDAMFDAGHLLKIASYLAILAGLFINVYSTFQREGDVLGILTEANTVLEREVAVRAQTEEAVKDGRTRLQDFLDTAHDLIQSVAPDGRILYANTSWKQTLGYTDEDLDGTSVFDVIHPSHRAVFQEELDRVLAGFPGRPLQIHFLTRGGETVILSGTATAQQMAGRGVGAQAIFRNVTDQRRAERELAESKANLAALVENTGDAIWSVDRDRRLITFNSAFALAVEALSGREPHVGDLPEEVFHDEEVDWYQEMYERALRGERHSSVRVEKVDGQLRYMELYANPIQGEEGVSGVVIFGKDVTPRRRAEEALRVAKEEAEAANKAKSDFLASMSHELRTPLNSIIGFANILLKNKDGNLSEKEEGFLGRVLSNGKHLLQLINEVLDLAKVEAGRMELIIEEVDLGRLITETVMQLEGQAKVKEGAVALLADVPDGALPVEADSAKLKQVIINLVGNALKFTHDGSVTVSLEVGGDGSTPTAISVKDTGIGIAQERLSAIFEAFQQAEAGTSRKYGGTGLGLAISRSICLLMGYDLVVSSELGKGSTFTIVMGERARKTPESSAQTQDQVQPSEVVRTEPAVAPVVDVALGEPAEESDPLSAASRMRDFRVLIIDDEDDSRDLLAHYLRELGCKVIVAADGPEGLRKADEYRPDLITVDLMMPDMPGWEVLRTLKSDEELRRIPVVVVSIVAAEGQGRLLGAVDLITKPFDREDILRVLWRNLNRRRGGRVLLMDRSERMRNHLSGVLSHPDLEVVTAEEGEDGLAMIRSEAPDAIILDLELPDMDGLTFLHRLRQNPSNNGIPAIVLTSTELSTADRNNLANLASGAVPRDERAGQHLRRMLTAIFGLEHTWETPS